MPDAQGNPSPGDPGYTAPAGAPATQGAAPSSSGLVNTTVAPPMNTTVSPGTPTAPPTAPYTPINQPTPAATPPTVPNDKTVAGGIEKLISSDSPLLQQARARAAAQMNERGLLNSSQGISAGESAVLDAATPIASADANQATTLAVAGQQAATQTYTANLASNTQLQTQAVTNAFQTAYQQADIAGKQTLQATHDAVSTQLAQIDANYHTLMQSSASAASVYQSTLGAIANIYGDTTIDAAGKATVINGYLGWMKQQMNLVGSVNGVDLTGLTDFGSVSA